jgi:hypothetical protein
MEAATTSLGVPMTMERVSDAEVGGSGAPEVTLARYVDAFSPAPPWDDLVAWPPDVFAVANLVLDHTEAYRFAVAPPAGRRWPPRADWDERVRAAAAAWREAAATPGAEAPAAVREQWDAVTKLQDLPLAAVRDGDSPELCEALLTLHAMADEACAGLSTSAEDPSPGPFERRAWKHLAAHRSLARLSPARVRITPKTHFATRGITIRSFSRYLALSYESVDLQWQRTEAAARWRPPARGRREFNLLLVPWPLEIQAEDFRRVDGPLDNMDRRAFGFFEFAPARSLPLDELSGVLDAARRQVGRIDAVVLPEGAVDASEIEPIEELLEAHGVGSLIAGVRARAEGRELGENRMHLGIRRTDGWQHLEQAKHHRWSLDEPQIRQYHLCRVLDPGQVWWEAIDLPERCVQVLDLGGGTTLAPLICEDLARLDEVADVLRRIGPTLVVAVLLDGPQLATRWPARYATILGDEPGSAVLTLTSYGMVARSRPPGARRSRVVALWSDPTRRLQELELGRGASALLVTACVGTKTTWTADGRRHDGTPDLTLSSVHQLRSTAPR